MTELSRVLVVGNHPVSHTQCSMESEWRLSESNLSLPCWDLGQKREHSQVNEVNRKSQGAMQLCVLTRTSSVNIIKLIVKLWWQMLYREVRLLLFFSVIYIV